LKLYMKLSIMTIGLIILTLIISGTLVGRWEFSRSEDAMEKNLMNVANVIATSSEVQDGLSLKTSENIQPFIKALLNSLEEVDIITVADMNSIRYGHPNEERLGEQFVGGDERAVVESGQSYVSVATGTLGRSVRAFKPVYKDGEQVGFVMTGHMYNTVLGRQRQMEQNFTVYAFWGVLIGSIGAFFIAQSIKKSLMNLEPDEIARLYRNQEAILFTAREGIIAIDTQKNITLINQSALKILKSVDTNVIGKPILDIFPDTGLIRVLETGESEIGQERAFSGTFILANRIPIYEDGELVGAMATFLDRTEFVKMAEEVTGVKIILQALRANTHEFRNKLHVVSGLLQLGDHDKARDYIKGVEQDNENIRRMISDKIENNTISALLIGKYNRAKEQGVNLYLTEDSELTSACDIPDDDMIIVIGNLIENAIEAMGRVSRVDGEIQVYLKNVDDEVICQIIDNGPGMTDFDCELSKNRGVTTKEGSSGIGLSLVEVVVTRHRGSLVLVSEPGQGVEATAIMKLGE